MIKNGVTIEKKDNKLHFYSYSRQNGSTYLYSKPFTKGEYLYFRGNRSMDELYSFHDWGKNPRLDKTIKRVIQMCKYVEKDMDSVRGYNPYLITATGPIKKKPSNDFYR